MLLTSTTEGSFSGSHKSVDKGLREQAKTSSPGTQQKSKDTRDVNPHLYTKEGKTQDMNSLKDIKFNSNAHDMQIKLRGPLRNVELGLISTCSTCLANRDLVNIY